MGAGLETIFNLGIDDDNVEESEEKSEGYVKSKTITRLAY